MSKLFPCYLYKFWVTSFVLLISTIELFSQDIKTVWFTESGQMVCNMCPSQPNYQLNYIGNNCSVWEAIEARDDRDNFTFIKFEVKTINSTKQVQQIINIDAGYGIITKIKFKRKGSGQIFIFSLNNKITPPVFVGFNCLN